MLSHGYRIHTQSDESSDNVRATRNPRIRFPNNAALEYSNYKIIWFCNQLNKSAGRLSNPPNPRARTAHAVRRPERYTSAYRATRVLGGGRACQVWQRRCSRHGRRITASKYPVGNCEQQVMNAAQMVWLDVSSISSVSPHSKVSRPCPGPTMRILFAIAQPNHILDTVGLFRN